MIVYLNGEFLPADQARISVEDRGFHFGDGVYEVIRSCDGGLFTAREHMERLRDGLKALEIRVEDGSLDPDSLMAVAETLLERNDRLKGDATVYVQVTRGSAPRIHRFPPEGCAPTVYLTTGAFSHPPGLHRRGARVITLPDLRWARCNLKTVNLLPNVLGKQRAVEAGAVEALFVRDGVVTEGASTNAFAVVDGALHTYPACHYILGGITRGVVIEMAAELGIPVRETGVRAEDLPAVDELFLTGTTTDVLPVVQVDDHRVADGKPGAVTRKLQAGLTERISAAGGVTA